MITRKSVRQTQNGVNVHTFQHIHLHSNVTELVMHVGSADVSL